MAKTSIATALATADEFFGGLIDDALSTQRVDTHRPVRDYLVSLMSHFVATENLFENSEASPTLAERYLRATQMNSSLQRMEALKRLGDSALYLSGFFGDSLHRKIIDIDYYINLGGSAYSLLAAEARTTENAFVFGEFSARFVAYVDVLTYVSQKSMIQSDSDLLRLYNRFLATGSDLAKAQLVEKGLLNAQVESSGKNQQ